MVIRAIAGAAGLVGGTATAATSGGGPDYIGIAALITAIGGLLTLFWTVYQGFHRKAALDAEAAADIIEVLEARERRKREGLDDAEG